MAKAFVGSNPTPRTTHDTPLSFVKVPGVGFLLDHFAAMHTVVVYLKARPSFQIRESQSSKASLLPTRSGLDR